MVSLRFSLLALVLSLVPSLSLAQDPLAPALESRHHHPVMPPAATLVPVAPFAPVNPVPDPTPAPIPTPQAPRSPSYAILPAAAPCGASFQSAPQWTTSYASPYAVRSKAMTRVRIRESRGGFRLFRRAAIRASASCG